MSTQTPQQWLKENWPNCKGLDENWTFERYDYPEDVRQWIRDNWVKISDDNGGTYYESSYHREKFPHLYQKQVENPEEDTPKDDTKSFAENYKKSEFYHGMDDANKKAMNVWSEKGTEEAVKHMFTDQKTGRTLSYSEMRSRYG
tara:strand:+ start:98 stop:529 length:432 start_codon:yes stop_codon:yes gene_type:complete